MMFITSAFTRGNYFPLVIGLCFTARASSSISPLTSGEPKLAPSSKARLPLNHRSSATSPSPVDRCVNSSSSSSHPLENDQFGDGVVAVTHPDGVMEEYTLEVLVRSLEPLASNLSVSVDVVATKTMMGVVQSMSMGELSTLLAETAASLATQHYDYSLLAARILLQQNYATTPPTFSTAMQHLNETLAPDLNVFIQRHSATLDRWILPENDNRITYLGFSTLQRSYLLRNNKGVIVERPQYLFLRVALGIHFQTNGTDDATTLEQARETYLLLSSGTISHASPTLFHAGTRRAQLSSCFLVQMSDDSIHGIYDTLATCAIVSKGAGGVGLAVSKIRARGTRIAGTGGVSNGLVPMLRVYDATCRYVDQGGGKRPGAFAIYLEPWHADVYEVLNLKKNHGKEEQRARDLFYGLWIPDLFMQRVYDDKMWSLMCPHQCPGLHECHGDTFNNLYLQYEREGRFAKQVRARDLWAAILDSQIETGTPYMLYKDACNAKSNHKHLGCISSSNLCTEIIQYTSPEEVAVCNLASLCLPAFVRASHPFGSPFDADDENVAFDHAALHRAVKIVTRNLNKIIDTNMYPVPESRQSNLLHRPIGIGVSGLADAFVRLGLPFASEGAKQLNEAIFETIYHAALEASAELAEEDGWYPSFPGSEVSKGFLQYHMWGLSDNETPSRRYFSKPRSRNRASGLGVYDEGVAARAGYDWDALRTRVMRTGLRNSLLVAPMPTASTAQIVGVNECFEPFSSNLYIRRVKAGEFIYTNPHLLHDLSRLGLWTPAVRNQLMRDGGSVQNIPEIPQHLKDLYKTVWEISMKDIIDMAADRGKFVDQSQSLNLFMADPTVDKITAMHFYAWRQGLKTGMYYLRTKPAVHAIQYTVDKDDALPQQSMPSLHDVDCPSCSV